MKLTIVGCSGSMSGPQSAASCYLVQALGADEAGKPRQWSIILDLGPGSFGQLWNYIDPGEIDAVFFSHLHADHMADVVSLQVYRKWHPNGCLPPLKMYGPSDLPDRVRGIDGVTEENYEGVFDFRQLEAGVGINVGPLQIEPREVWHTVTAFGFRITGPSDITAPSESAAEKVLAYTGDTDLCERTVGLAQGVDLLLCEAGFTEQDIAPRGIHLTGGRAGELARDSGVKRMVLTHIQPWTDPEIIVDEAASAWQGDIDVAAAGRTFDL